MNKYIHFILGLTLLGFTLNAQISYKETFGGLVLNQGPASPTQALSAYTTVPTNYLLLNDGFTNNAGGGLTYNKPFNNAALKTTGWACVYNASVNDTFLVATSWLDSVATCNRWVITPPITIPNDTSVLTWNAMSPDANFADGYEVYLTTTTSTNVSINDFTPPNRLFALADNNTAGGGELPTWTKRAVSLAGYSGQTVRFAFRNNSRDRYQLWIDDIEVVRLQVANDAAAFQMGYTKYSLAGSSQTASISVSALGSQAISTISVSYKIGSTFPITEVFTINPPLTYGQSKVLSFSAPFTITSPGNYAFKVWINTVNGVPDQNKFNDTLSNTLSVQTTTPVKKVLIEQFTSARDGACSQSQVNFLALSNSSVIAISVHGADSLQNHNASGLVVGYKTNFATAMVDRQFWMDENSVALNQPKWAVKVTERLNSISPTVVSIINKNYNSVTRELSFTVKADFVAEVKGDYRFNAAIVENNVYGPILDSSDNGFNQYNNFYFTPWSAYYQMGYFNTNANTYILKANAFKHQRVLNRSLDGAFGLSGSIPSNGGTLNQSFTKTFTLTLPQPANGLYQWNADNIYLVGYVAEYNFDKTKRTVLNATQEKLTAGNEVISVGEQRLGALNWAVYPNPAQQFITIQLANAPNAAATVTITDLMGKVVYTGALTSGFASLDLGYLSSGTYILSVWSDGQMGYRKLILTR